MTSNFIALLESLMFKVNRTKSFTGDQAFRESCGGFYVDDKDVTPVLLKIKDLTASSVGTKGVDSVIDCANRLLSYGYIHARKVILNLHYVGRSMGCLKTVPLIPYSSLSGTLRKR
jgi:hypothetical protein